jgi:hypothetical protein
LVTELTTPSGDAEVEAFTVRMELPLAEELRAIARENRRSVSAQVAVYVDAGIERDRHGDLDKSRHARADA